MGFENESIKDIEKSVDKYINSNEHHFPPLVKHITSNNKLYNIELEVHTKLFSGIPFAQQKDVTNDLMPRKKVWHLKNYPFYVLSDIDHLFFLIIHFSKHYFQDMLRSMYTTDDFFINLSHLTEIAYYISLLKNNFICLIEKANNSNYLPEIKFTFYLIKLFFNTSDYENLLLHKFSNNVNQRNDFIAFCTQKIIDLNLTKEMLLPLRKILKMIVISQQSDVSLDKVYSCSYVNCEEKNANFLFKNKLIYNSSNCILDLSAQIYWNNTGVSYKIHSPNLNEFFDNTDESFLEILFLNSYYNDSQLLNGVKIFVIKNKKHIRTVIHDTFTNEELSSQDGISAFIDFSSKINSLSVHMSWEFLKLTPNDILRCDIYLNNPCFPTYMPGMSWFNSASRNMANICNFGYIIFKPAKL